MFTSLSFVSLLALNPRDAIELNYHQGQELEPSSAANCEM